MITFEREKQALERLKKAYPGVDYIESESGYYLTYLPGKYVQVINIFQLIHINSDIEYFNQVDSTLPILYLRFVEQQRRYYITVIGRTSSVWEEQIYKGLVFIDHNIN